MLETDAKVYDLSSDDHNEDQVLKNVHELILTLSIVFGETDLRQVLMLLDKVVIERGIPPKGLSKVKKEPRVILNLDKACSIGVVEGPAVSEVLAQVATHKLAIFFHRLVEGR